MITYYTSIEICTRIHTHIYIAIDDNNKTYQTQDDNVN